MFLTLVGVNADGAFEILVGSPAQADRILGSSSPFALAPVYDRIAKNLRRAGFVVRRNPLVHRPRLGTSFSLAELRDIANDPGGEALLPAIEELVQAGAVDATPVQIRDWHHITWNNCLVENSTTTGKHVYLPTFGHGEQADLAIIDRKMQAMWEALGFTVHMLGDFNPFAERQGVVHCIKKYLERGD